MFAFDFLAFSTISVINLLIFLSKVGPLGLLLFVSSDTSFDLSITNTNWILFPIIVSSPELCFSLGLIEKFIVLFPFVVSTLLAFTLTFKSSVLESYSISCKSSSKLGERSLFIGNFSDISSPDILYLGLCIEYRASLVPVPGFSLYFLTTPSLSTVMYHLPGSFSYPAGPLYSSRIYFPGFNWSKVMIP